MRNIFTLCLVALATMFAGSAMAQTDPTFSLEVGESDNLAKVPVTVSMANPDMDVTAFEVTLVTPVGNNKFAYDDEEEDYVMANTDRWAKSHSLFSSEGSALRPDGFYVSVTSAKTQLFKNTEGALITLYLDCSSLADGNYTVTAVNVAAVTPDAVNHPLADLEAKFTVKDGKVVAYTEPTPEEDPTLTVIVGEGPASKIPVNLVLTNPTAEITAVEASLIAPVAVDKFVYDADEEDYAQDNTDRWSKSHAAMISAGSAEHPDALYVSIASNKSANFSGAEGTIITVYLDGSSLADGKYVIKLVGGIAVWTDKSTTKTYESPEMEAEFTVKDGKATAVESIVADAVKAAKTIYTLDGKVVAQPQKGQIYIINGKAVKY